MDADKEVTAYFRASSTTVPPSPSRTPGYATLPFEDDFSNPNSGWTVTSAESTEMAYENGEYSVLVKKEGWLAWGTNASIGQLSDFVVEVDARRLSGGNEGIYGIIFRQTGAEPGKSPNWYAFWIRSSDGNYSINKVVEGKSSALLDWRSETSIVTLTLIISNSTLSRRRVRLHRRCLLPLPHRTHSCLPSRAPAFRMCPTLPANQ